MTAVAKKGKTLAQAVAKRKALLKEIVLFVEDLAHRRGQVTKREQGSSHTNIVRKLEDFGGFSFFTDSGHSMMGGNDVKIVRHSLGKSQVVLDLYYQSDVEECEVKTFVEDRSWPKVLRQVMRNEQKIADVRRTRAEKASVHRTTEHERREREIRLVETARRLRV